MIRYIKTSGQTQQGLVETMVRNHPPWALPSFVVDPNERIRNTLYFCENLQAVSQLLSIMGNGEDRSPDRLSVQPYEPFKLYIDPLDMNELLFMFLKADQEHSNWTVVCEYKDKGVEYEILSL